MKVILFAAVMAVLWSTSVFSIDNLKQTDAFVQKLIQLGELRLAQKNSPTPGDEIAKLEKDLSSRIDYDSFSNQSLGGAAKKIQLMEKKEFKKLLQDILEKTIFPRADQMLAYKKDIHFEKKGQTILLTGKWMREKNGDRVVKDFSADLFFNKSGQIKDASFDGQKLSQSISKQIQKHLEKKKFEELLTQMKKRVEKLEKSQANPS
jgi:ABC-type transporter MlaC component